ncbi:MAG: inverse autotransporter beta domain-containing protein [Hoeflea sp.]|uniref:inverse autotransporter beta domain-containing protein n=1 Tax=Hoeflea sp. TaxID=1940281 RepID=UPI003EF92D70
METSSATYIVGQQDIEDNLGILLDRSYGAVTPGVTPGSTRGFIPGVDGFAGDKKWQPHVEFTVAPGGKRTLGQVNLFAPLAQDADSLLFADLRASAWTGDVQEGNFGAGYRQIVPGGFFGTDAIFGAYGFFDARRSSYENMFYQGTFGAELITERFEFRANGYLPTGKQYVVGSTGSGVALNGVNIVSTGTELVERALPGFDVEAGIKIDFSEAAIRLNAGYFRFERGDTLVEGPRFRAEVEIEDPFGFQGAKLSFGGEIRTDKVRGTEASGIVRLRMPIGGISNSVEAERQLSGLDRLMTRRVYRDDDIVSPVVQGQGIQIAAPITDAVSGESLQAFFVANSAQGAADCSGVANACDFVTAQGLAGAGDTFLPVDVAGAIGSVFTLNNDRQQVIGAGNSGSATVILPDSDSSVLIITSLGGRPVVSGVNIGHFADTRITGLLANSATGITGSAFTGSATINDVITSGGGLNFANSAASISVTDAALNNAANPGIVLTGLTGSGSFSNVDVVSAGGTGLSIDGGSFSATFDSNSSFTQSGAAPAIEVLNSHSGTLTSEATITASNGTGLRFSNADGSYNFNGPSNLNGGDAGVDILGGSAGTFAFGADTAIISPTGMAFNVTGSAATVSYNGTITQTNAASAISVTNNTGGSVTFGGRVTANTFTATGVNLTGNAGATVGFTGGLDIDTTTGTGFSATGGGTVSVAATAGDESINSTAGQALNLNGVTIGAGGVNFDSLSSAGSGSTGIDINGVTGGAFTVSGATTMSGSTGNAIQLTGNSAALNFNGATAITMTSASVGVDFAGTSGGAVSFADLDIALQSANAPGIDFSGAMINANVTATDFDLTSISTTGTTAVDLSGTTGTGAIRLGDTDIGGASATIAGVNTGVQFNAASNATFIFGDGEAATDKQSSISATTAIAGGSTVTLGSYDFDDVNFTGTLDFTASGGGLVFVAANATGDFSGSDVNNRANAATADLIGASGTTFVLINDGAAIDDVDGFTLADGQTMASFGNGRTFNTSGLVIPANFSGISGSGAAVSDPTGNGAAILTRTGGAGDTLTVSGTVNLQDFIIENAAGAGLSATGAATIISTGLTVQNVAGQGIDLNTLTGTASTFSNLAVSSTTGNAVDIVNSNVSFTGGLDIATVDGVGFNATGGGTVSVAASAGTEQIVATGTGTALNLDGVTVATGGINFDQVTTAATSTGTGVNINDAAGGTITLTSVSLDGTAGTAGLDISGAARASTVVVSGGAIASGVRIDGAGSGTVQVEANVSENAGYAVQLSSRTAASGAVTVGGTVTSATGAVSIQSSTGGNVTFNGTVTGTGSNNAGAINIDTITGGTVMFAGLADIDVTGAGTGVSIANSNAGGSFSFTGGLAINSAGGTGFEALSGTVSVAATAGDESITSTAGQALNLNGVTIGVGGMTFDSLLSAGSATTGIDINGVTGGAFTVSGATTMSGSTGNAIQLTGNTAALNFNGATAITMTSASVGVDFAGTSGGAVSFADLDIALQSANATGIDFSGAMINANVTATDFDLTSTSTTGTTAVDLSGTTGTGIIELGDADISGGNASIAGVNIGVQFSAASNATFIFGDGEATTDKGSSISATTAIAGGSVVVSGSYDFDDVNFTGTLDFTASGGGLVFVAANATGDFSGSDVNNRANAATADLIGASGTTFVLINDGAAIDDVDGFTLADGQTMASFGNGRTFNTSGLVIPVNFSGISGSGAAVSDPTGNGAAILTRTGGAGDTLTVSGTVNLQDFIIENAAGAGLSATGATTIISTGLTVQNVAGQGIDLNTLTGTASTFNDTKVSTTTGNAIDIVNSMVNFTGGLDIETTTGTGFSATGGSVVNVTEGAQPNQITATAGRVVNINAVSGSFNFTTLTSTNAPVDALVIASFDTGSSFNVSGVTTITTPVDDGIDFDDVAGSTTFGGAVNVFTPGDDGIDIEDSSNGTISFQSTVTVSDAADSGIEINGFNAGPTATGSITFAGLVDIDRSAVAGINIIDRVGSISFANVDIDTVGVGGVIVGAATLDGTLSFGQLDINGGGGTSEVGFGVAPGSSGMIDINGGTIENIADEAFGVLGSTVTLTYTGTVTQSTAGVELVLISIGDMSNVTFEAGSILQATNGTGLQFNNADGTYEFAGTTTLNGGDAGIDIIAGSAGAFTFGASTAITSPSGTAFNLDAGSATVNFNGTIAQANAASAVSVTGNTGGTADFAGLVTASTSSATGVNLVGNGGATVSFTGGLDIDTTTGTGFSATGGGTVSVAATAADESINSTGGQALNLNGVTIGAAGVNFDSLSSTSSGSTGIDINGVSGGAFTVSGATTMSGSTGNAIQLTGNTAALNFNGATAITMTSGSVGVDFAGPSGGAVSFADLDIALQNANATGIDFSGAMINANVTAADFDLTSTSTTGTTAVDLSGTTGTGAIRLGDTDIGGASATIAGVNTGVQFNAASNATFIFGDGEATTDKQSSISATTAIAGGSTVTLGSYDFDDVNFTGTLDFNPAGAALVFVAANATGDFSGSDVNNRANAATADLIGASGTIFILINDGAAIDDVDGFTLVDGQTMASFGNGRTFNTSGLVIPTNFSGVPGSSVTVTDPTGNGAAILTRTGGAGDTMTASGTVNLQDFVIENAAAGAGLAATGATTITSTGLTVQNVAGQGVDLNTLTGAGSTFSNLAVSSTTGNAVDIVNSNVSFAGGLDIATTTGIGFQATGGGSISVAATAGVEQVVASGTGTAINLDGITVGAGGIQFDQVTTATTSTGTGVNINDATGGTITLTSVNLDGTAPTAGLDISGNARTANVVVTGGTIANGVAISGNGSGTVAIDASIGENAGYAVQITNRGAGAGQIDINGAVTSSTGAVSIQSNTAGTVNFGGTVTGTGANTAGSINVDTTTGGIVTFAGLVDIDVTGSGTGVAIANSNTGGTFNFTGGLDINSVDGTGFEALSGTNGVSNAGTESITVGNAAALVLNGVTANVTFDVINASNTAKASIDIDNTDGAFTLNGGTFNTAVTGASFSTIDIEQNDGGATRALTVAISGVTINHDASATAGGDEFGIKTLTQGDDSLVISIANSNFKTEDQGVMLTSTTGLTTVTDFSNNTLFGDNTAFNPALFQNGVQFSGVVFDSNLGLAGLQEVSGGAFVAGTLAERVSNGAIFSAFVPGLGFVAPANQGTLRFANYNVFASNFGIVSSNNQATATLAVDSGNIDAASITLGSPVNLDVTLSTLTLGGGTTANKLVLGDVSGSFSVTGATSITATTNETAIDLAGTIGAAITFADLDIALTGDNATGIDLSGATINANLTAGDFDVTSTSTTGTIGVNLVGTTGTGTVQLGDTNTNGGPTSTIGTAANLLAIGVQVDAATNLSFVLGDGDGTTGDLVESNIHATTAISGTLPTNGNYNFRDINFNASGVANISGGASFFVFDEEGTAGAGTFADPGTAAQAAAASVNVLVAIDNSGVGGSTIDLSSAGQGTINTLTLDDSQALIGLINGQSVDVSTLGLGLSAGAPPSFLFTGIGGTTTITGAGVAGAGLATITTTGANNTVSLTGTAAIVSAVIANGGTGDGISASFGVAESVIIRSSTIGGGTGGEGINIATTAGASTFDFSDLTMSSGLRFNGTAGGTLTGTATGTNTIANAAGKGLYLDTVAIGAGGFTFDSVSSTNAGAGNAGILLDTLTGAGAVTITTATVVDSGGAGGGHAIDLTNIGMTGALTIANINIDLPTTGGNSLRGIMSNGGHTSDINLGTGAGGVAIDDAALGIQLNGTAGTINIGTGAGSGGVQLNTRSSAIYLGSDSTGTINIGTTATTSAIVSGTGLGAPGISFNQSDATVTVTGIDINGTGIGTAGHGIHLLDNDAVGSFTLTGTNTIDNTGGDAILVNNAAATISGVAIGASATGAGDDITGAGIRIDNTDGTSQTVALSNITMGSGGAGDTGDVAGIGIDINSSGAGVLTVNLSGTNIIRSTGQALDVDETGAGPVANNLLLNIGGTTFESAAIGVPSIEVTGQNVSTTTNTVGVRGFAGNTVIGNGSTSRGGILFTNVDFDSDGAGGQVAAGTLNIGQSAVTRVRGDGLSLINPTGDLAFTTLNVFNDNGTGLEVDTKGAGTTFNLVNGGGAVDTTNGTALFLDPLTMNLTFATVTATGGANGVFIDAGDASGGAGSNALTITTLNVTGSTGAGLVINNSTGTFNFGTTTIDNTATAGGGVDIDATGSDSTNLNFTNGLDIDTDSGAGFHANVFVSSAFNLEVVNAGTETINTVTGQILDILNVDSAGTGINFDSLTATGTTVGDAVDLDLDSGTFNGGAVTIAGSTGDGINLSGTGGTINFASATIDNALSAAIRASFGGTATFTTVDIDGGSTGVLANGGGTLNITGGSIGASTGTTGTAVQLTSGSGNVSIGASITNTSGSAFRSLVDRSGTITLSGAINDTGSGISIANNTGSTFNFTNASKVFNTGATDAITLSNNTGATINFTGGGLNIDTTSGTGFTAIGGGTVNVTGNGNSVTTTTGSAININATTIGGSGVTFQSVSSNGATNGIVLNATGAGAFTVSGDGSTPAGRGGNNSGGQIFNSTGTGISLTDTRDVSLAHMTISDAADHGIDALRVNGLTASYLTLNSNGTADQEHGIRITDAAGAYSLSKLSADGNFDAHIRALQQTGATALTSFLVDDSLFQNVTTGSFEDGILFEMQTGTTVGTLTVQNSSFNNHDGDQIQVALNGTATITTTTLSSNATTATGTNLGGGFTIGHAGTFTGSHTINVTNNNIQSAKVQSININVGSHQAPADVSATITGNTIGTAGVANSGGNIGIEVEINGVGGTTGGVLTALISNNTIREYVDQGIQVQATDGAGNNSTLNATITGNTVTEALAAGFGFAAIFVDANNNNTVCVDIGGAGGLSNTLSGTGFATDVSIRTASGATVNLEDYVGGANDSGAINTYLTGRNTMSAGIHQFGGGSTAQGGGACAVP